MTLPASTAIAGRGPKYLQIADALREQIQDGTLEPRSKLPAEAELAKHFGVSPPTVRQAMSVLRAELLIESLHGVGTFVRENQRRQRRSRNRYGRARGDQQLLNDALEHRIVFAGQAPAPEHVAEAMGVDPGTPVVVRRRHLHSKATGDLEEIGASYIPLAFAASTYLEEPTVVPKALFLCIEDQAGKTYHHARDTSLYRLADPAESEALKLAPAAAVLHLLHTAWAEDGTTLEVSESIWPAEKVIFIDEYDVPQHAETPARRSDI